jgi:glycosyltransferase involved in cell wall biosynthesis
MPTVSIIVPNYNHARFLPKRIGSILEQTYQDFELILLDDCSTDESRAILTQYANDPRVRIEFNETNSGSTFKQWNKGVRLARGKYVWLAESDDYADERLLERLVAVLDKEPAVTLAYCQSWRILDDGQLDGLADYYLDYLDPQRWKADFCTDGREECESYLICSNTIPNASAVVFRREIYERVGGADESLRLCGDWKLWASMVLEGKVSYLGEPLNYYRTHNKSVRSKSRKKALDVAEDLQLVHWLLERITPTEAVRERICQDRVESWVPALMSFSVASPVKLTILKNAIAIDRHPIRRAVRPAFLALGAKLSRGWHSVRSTVTTAKT